MCNLKQNSYLQGGKYKIIRFISSGGFGCTYEAEHTLLHKRVAIKEFFVKDFCNRDSNTMNVSVAIESKRGLVDKLRRKFCDEAVAISKFSHPNIVKVYDVFEEHNTYYYVMDYLTGGSLKDIVKQNGRISEPEATAYILQLCDALRYVHENNCLHLDIKPGNVMLDNNGRVVLIDFGAAKQYDEVSGENTSSLMGKTPGYAPIEQIGNDVHSFTPATDIYSVGATFFNLLTGITPPEATKLLEEGFPTNDLRSVRINKALVFVIEKAMSLAKKDRYQDILEMIKDINVANHAVFNLYATDNVESECKPSSSLKNNEETEVIVHHQKGKANQSFEVNGVKFDMVYVEGGTFFMGATPEQGGDATYHEKPVHKVALSDYYIGETQVTQKLWEAVMGNNPSCHVKIYKKNKLQPSFHNLYGNKSDDSGVVPEDIEFPVENVSWNDVQGFLERLNKLTGKRFVLPTEAQWEYAARGGNKSKGYKYSGSNNIYDVAWFNDVSGDNTHPVATKKPNELGIYDMSGNVSEWCDDWFCDYDLSSQTDPSGTSTNSHRARRGGSYYVSAKFCRISYRNGNAPGFSAVNLGFRLALSR